MERGKALARERFPYYERHLSPPSFMTAGTYLNTVLPFRGKNSLFFGGRFCKAYLFHFAKSRFDFVNVNRVILRKTRFYGIIIYVIFRPFYICDSKKYGGIPSGNGQQGPPYFLNADRSAKGLKTRRRMASPLQRHKKISEIGLTKPPPLRINIQRENRAVGSER